MIVKYIFYTFTYSIDSGILCGGAKLPLAALFALVTILNFRYTQELVFLVLEYFDLAQGGKTPRTGPGQ